MGKIYSSLAGKIRGRIGSTVYRKGQRATVASEYQPQVANPKTQQQAINRCAWATASAAASALNSIVNHSHQGVAGKRENLQRFVKQNRAMLIAKITKFITEGTGYLGGLNLKSVSGIQPAPYIISEGSVPFAAPNTISTTGGAEGIVLTSTAAAATLTATITTQEAYVAALAELGLTPNDQLSVVEIVSALNESGSYDSSISGTVSNVWCNVLASRVTFVAEIPEDFSGTLVVDGRFNPALIKRQEGELRIALLETNTKAVIFDGRVESTQQVVAGCLVRSQLDMNGKYMYSPAVMDVSFEPNGDPRDYVESFMAISVPAEGSDKFLDNPGLKN